MKKFKKIFGVTLVAIGLLMIAYMQYEHYSSSKAREKLEKEFEEIQEENRRKKEEMAAIESVKKVDDLQKDEVAQDITIDDNNITNEEPLTEIIKPDEVEQEVHEIVQDEEEMQQIKDNDLKIIARLSIEKIDISYIVVEGVDRIAISKTLGHFEENAMPGEVGNFAVAGHRGGKYGKFFKNLDKLETNDEIVIEDTEGNIYTYLVTSHKVIEPTDFSVLESNNKKEITLITCADSGTRRLVVFGELKE